MLSLVNFNLFWSNRVQRLHKQDVHTIEDDLDDISWLLDSFNFSNISLFDRLHCIFSFFKIGQGGLKLYVSLISFCLNHGTLLLTSLSNFVYFFGLNVSCFVLHVKLFKKFVCSLSCGIKILILFDPKSSSKLSPKSIKKQSKILFRLRWRKYRKHGF